MTNASKLTFGAQLPSQISAGVAATLRIVRESRAEDL